MKTHGPTDPRIHEHTDTQTHEPTNTQTHRAVKGLRGMTLDLSEKVWEFIAGRATKRRISKKEFVLYSIKRTAEAEAEFNQVMRELAMTSKELVKYCIHEEADKLLEGME